MKKQILVVCSGNSCRSPLAQAILNARFDSAGLDIKVLSAGTGDVAVGNTPDQRGVVAARLKGYDTTQIRSRRLSDEDFAASDLILAMDLSVLKDVDAHRPADDTTPTEMLTKYAPEGAMKEVPDPYFTGKFNLVIALIEDCAVELVAQLWRDLQ